MPVSPGSMPSYFHSYASPTHAHSSSNSDSSSPPPALKFYGKLYDANLWGISRFPGAVLALSDFDPTPISVDPSDAFQNMNLNAHVYHPKRVVMISMPSGRVMSRFVPDAPREEGVGFEGEGYWPRMVVICGHETFIGQDQWDLYKLSNRFECVVRAAPHLTTIVERVVEPQRENARPAQQSPTRNRGSGFKPPPGVQRRVKKEQKRNERYKRRPQFPFNLDDIDSSEDEKEDDAADEDEVMHIVDEPGTPKRYQQSEYLRRRRAMVENDRKERRERNKQKRRMKEEQMPNEPEDTTMSNAEPHYEFPDYFRAKSMEPTTSQEGSNPTNSKRKADEQEPASEEEEPRTSKLYEKASGGRRHRTMSPMSAAKAAKASGEARRKRRMRDAKARYKARTEARERTFMQSIYEEAETRFFTSIPQENFPEPEEPEDFSMAEEPMTSDDESSEEETPGVDEEATRRASIEESIRKMRELDNDKPLWEEGRRRREAQEQQERRELEARRREKQERAQAEARRQQEEEKRKLEEEARRQREAEAARNSVNERRRVTRENILRKVNHICRQTGGHWNPLQAANWYREQCDVFDKTKWTSPDAVFVFESIPWPTLLCPGRFHPESITWEETEAFFKRAKMYWSADEYQKILKKSTIRFHPDRWTGKGVLTSVEDEGMKEKFKEAGLRASKAITALFNNN